MFHIVKIMKHATSALPVKWLNTHTQNMGTVRGYIRMTRPESKMCSKTQIFQASQKSPILLNRTVYETGIDS